MKTVLNASDDGTLFLNHLAQDRTTLARLVRIERLDGVVICMTTHDKNLTYDGEVYYSKFGYNPSAIRSSASLAVDNLSVEGFFELNGVLRNDLIAGRFDGALCDIFLVNWNDVSMGALWLKSGYFGSVDISDYKYTVDFLDLTQKLQQETGRVIQPGCDLKLGCELCGVDIASAAYTKTGTITGDITPSKDTFSITISEGDTTDGYYNFGIITFDSSPGGGDNWLIFREIYEQEYDDSGYHSITLFLPFPFVPSVGDTFTIYPGCDGTLQTCNNKFSNDSFQGFPHAVTEEQAADYGTG